MINSLVQLAILVFGSTVLYVTAVIVYRLTLHPLAKYPGPFLAKVTSWYDVYHCYLRDRHIDQLRCQRKYGEVFRYGPNYLVVQTPGGLRDIYTQAKTNPIRKGKMYKMLADHGVVSVHAAIDKDVHAFKRRVLSYGFSENALKSLEPLMVDTINAWLEVLNEGASSETKGWSSAKNMAHYANYVTFDVLGDLCFGQPFGLLESEELRDFPQVMLGRASILLVLGNSPVGEMYKYLSEKVPGFERIVNPKTYFSSLKVRAFAQKALRSRAASNEELVKNGEQPRKDFIHYLSQAKDPETGAGYNQHELIQELRLLIVAGSDTSSIVMAAAFSYLLRNPRVLEKLQKEMRSTFSDVEQIVTGPTLSSCTYLRAVIDECLRMAPPVPSSLPRETESPGMTVDGIPLPAGISVGSAAFGMHYNPAYFSSPYTFYPERWLPEYTSKEEIEVAKSSFCPFSLGNRGCIGKPMAYNELSIALGRLYWTYDMRLKAGDRTGQAPDDTYELWDIFVCGRDGPYVEFRKHDRT